MQSLAKGHRHHGHHHRHHGDGRSMGGNGVEYDDTHDIDPNSLLSTEE